jgi:murein DD-endopeptidase MepM/ murein hydrolase activator NlpD
VVGFCSGHGNAFFEWPDIFGQVTQGPNGTFTHTNDEAWDIGMSTGTSVYAARPGTVVFKEETKTDTCDPPADDQEDPKCDGNGVRIRHSDGSTASYWHLETDEVLVNKYDLVDRGQRIALSGNTGYSTGPHLHLESSRNQAAENAWFHAWKGFELDEVNCYEPQKGDLIGNLFLD